MTYFTIVLLFCKTANYIYIDKKTHTCGRNLTFGGDLINLLSTFPLRLFYVVFLNLS